MRPHGRPIREMLNSCGGRCSVLVRGWKLYLDNVATRRVCRTKRAHSGTTCDVHILCELFGLCLWYDPLLQHCDVLIAMLAFVNVATSHTLCGGILIRFED
jgi:hypothetical protein